MKRFFDFTFALLGFLILLPLLLVLGILVAMFLGRPVIFKQMRPGHKGKPFSMFKLRTLTDVRGEDGKLLPDHQRMTKFGSFLRSTSLDELPELLNVLKGEMSIVGPRPLLMEYLPLYNEEQARRHDVRPGITGWAQINGRNAISWEDKFKLDIWYVDHQNVLLDLKIIFQTIKKVFVKEGISSEGSVTAHKFEGSNIEIK